MSYKPGDIVNGHVLGADNAWHPVPRPKFMSSAEHALLNLLGFGILGALFTVAGLALGIGTFVDRAGTTKETGIVRRVATPDSDMVWLEVAVPNHARLVRVSTNSNVASDYPVGSHVGIFVGDNPNEAVVDDGAEQYIGSVVITAGGLLGLGVAAYWRSERRSRLAAA